ncbi:MAG: histone deacetylase family protein [Ignisphaera sp.]
MENVKIVTSRLFYKHNPPHGIYHPENAKRLDIVLNSLAKEDFSREVVVVDELNEQYYSYRERVHTKNYVSFIRYICSKGDEKFIDSDTYVNKHTFDVATHAIGCSVYATELALSTKEVLVFALVRPPVHHVGLNGKAMGAPTQGFCIFNNAAAAALYALDKGLKPITIIDIDVHHGNGTQEIFWGNPNVIHIDIHEYDIYPGTGGIEDLGEGEGYGTKINIPLPPYTSDDDYLYVVEELVIPITLSVKPRVIVLSAGFDAYAGEEIAFMQLTNKAYKNLGSLFRMLSRELKIGISAILEGGYSVGLEKGVPMFLKSFDQFGDIDRRIEPSNHVINITKRLIKLLNQIYPI